MFRTHILILFIVTVFLFACSDDPAPGGNNPISGVDVGQDVDTSTLDGDTAIAPDSDAATGSQDVALPDANLPDTEEDTSDAGDHTDPSDTEDAPDTQDADTGDVGSCPDPSDHQVYYVSEDIAECAAILFVCEASQLLFSNECGCGCVGPRSGTDQSCGGFAGDTCAANEYCLYETNSETDCLSNGIGTCTVRPDTCPGISEPVCACDGQTYDNACLARAARIDVYTNGPCQLL